MTSMKNPMKKPAGKKSITATKIADMAPKSKPVKKTPMAARAVAPSYEEPMRPKKPNCTADKKRMK